MSLMTQVTKSSPSCRNAVPGVGAGLRRGAWRARRCRAQRNGPRASLPCRMSSSATSCNATSCASRRTGLPCITTCGCQSSVVLPRLRWIVPFTGSKWVTVPACLGFWPAGPVGSQTLSLSRTLHSWLGSNRYSHTVDFATRPTSRTSCRPPMVSGSSRKSEASYRSRRSKYAHHSGLASLLGHSSRSAISTWLSVSSSGFTEGS